MTFSEINVAGVLVSPVSVVVLGSWAAASVVRVLLTRSGLMRHVWHPALVVFSTFVLIVSTCMLAVSGR